MTSPLEYEILPKLLPQVIKAIVDLHELNGSTIQDIIDQVQTNMAFYGLRSTKRIIKAQVHLCLRHGVRLGCFRVESQGKFRINKLKYCVPVLKCVLSPHCVKSAIKSRYLLRHCTSSDGAHQQQQKQLQQQQQKPQQLQQTQRNQQTKKSNINTSTCKHATRKTCPRRSILLRRPPCSTIRRAHASRTAARTPSSLSQPRSRHASDVISEMNMNDADKSILPLFRNPLTSYKKSSNTSVICIYDPAGHLGPQMECSVGSLKLDSDSTTVNNKLSTVATSMSRLAVKKRRKTKIKSTVPPTIQSSIVSTKNKQMVMNTPPAITTKNRSSADVQKLKQSEGVLKSLQRKFDQLQKCIWGGASKSSSKLAIAQPNSKDTDSTGFLE